MTPWGIRKRLHRWLILKLTGLDFDALNAIEPDPTPEPVEDSVIPVPDGTPFLGADAMDLIAKSRPVPAVEPAELPLVGSAEERIALTRPRW